MARNKRRQIVVDRQFQLQYLYIWLFVSVGLVAVSVGFYFLIRATTGGFSALRTEVLALLVGMSVFVVLFSLLMGILSVAMTHKVAGAAWRLNKSVEALSKGKSSDVIFTLRKGDYLQTLAASLRDLKEVFLRKQELMDKVAAKLEELQTSLGDRLSKEEKETLAALCREARRTRESDESGGQTDSTSG